MLRRIVVLKFYIKLRGKIQTISPTNKMNVNVQNSVKEVSKNVEKNEFMQFFRVVTIDGEQFGECLLCMNSLKKVRKVRMGRDAMGLYRHFKTHPVEYDMIRRVQVSKYCVLICI